MSSPSFRLFNITVSNRTLPVKVYMENRHDVRASIGRQSVHFRLPHNLNQHQFAHHWAWLTKWLDEQLTVSPHLLNRIVGKEYKDGDIIYIYNKTYLIDLKKVSQNSHTIRVGSNRVLCLRIVAESSEMNCQKAIRELISKAIATDCLPAFSRQVNDLNALHFKEPINHIRLKHNQSNWGSCSANRNVNFSTRLLFAPMDVIDYVIIHELAHLKELNHSDAFWRLVETAMPNFKEKEEWLKQNSASCGF